MLFVSSRRVQCLYVSSPPAMKQDIPGSMCVFEEDECFHSPKLVETDAADSHQNIESHHQRPPPPRCRAPSPAPPSSPHPPSNVLSVHQHKLNLLLMIALLTRRGSIHSRRPATATGQISWREEEEKTL